MITPAHHMPARAPEVNTRQVASAGPAQRRRVQAHETPESRDRVLMRLSGSLGVTRSQLESMLAR